MLMLTAFSFYGFFSDPAVDVNVHGPSFLSCILSLVCVLSGPGSVVTAAHMNECEWPLVCDSYTMC